MLNHTEDDPAIFPLLNETVSLPNGDKINFVVLGYKLELATSFGTSHSTSTFRKNALLLLRLPFSQCCQGHEIEEDAKGDFVLKAVGEVGLPPKKELVYEADLDDIVMYLTSFLQEVRLYASTGLPQADVFLHISHPYFDRVRIKKAASSVDAHGWLSIQSYEHLLQALDSCQCNSLSYGRAGKALVESAIFDLWAKDLRVPLYDLMNVPSLSDAHRSFYTAALNVDISLIVDAAIFGSKFTPHLKIKLNDSVELAKTILYAINEALPHQDCHNSWSIDANAAGSPSISERMLFEVLMPYKRRIFMVEQPFPVDIHSGQHDCDIFEQWVEVKAKYNNSEILVFADESMRTASDVSLLAPIVNGVNIKLEKCGGLRAALVAVEEAQKHDMLVWFGCMVGSNVNSTTTAHLFSLACCSDLDGALLVTDTSKVFNGGFQYAQPHGNILLDKECGGIGVAPKDEFLRIVNSLDVNN